MPIDTQSKAVTGDSKKVKNSRQDPLSKFQNFFHHSISFKTNYKIDSRF